MAGRKHPPSLKDLEGRLKAARSRQQEARGEGGNGKKIVPGSGLGFGLRIAVDLLAGLVLGVVIGLLLDSWLGTSPLMLVVFLFLGAAAGMLNVYRVATGKGFAVGYRENGDRENEAGDEDKGAKPDGGERRP